MKRILLTSLLTVAAFSNSISLPATAIGERICQERGQTINKTEDNKTHRQQHREQILNKQVEKTDATHRQNHQQQVMNKHICF